MYDGRNFIGNSFTYDSSSPFVIRLLHLRQFQHHIHVQLFFLSREAEPAPKVQLWITTHQNNTDTNQSNTIIVRDEVPSCWAGYLVNDLSHS